MAISVERLLAEARDAITVKRVFGDPIERDGRTLIPVANVMGGFGGGGGDQADGNGSGSGGGFGVRATPAGVYVIDQGQVHWEPALNLNMVILGGQVMAIAIVFAALRFGQAIREQRSRRAGVLSRVR